MRKKYPEINPGCKFGRLTVTGKGERYVTPGGRSRARWTCMCDCGNEVQVVASKLNNGHTSSCGCLCRDRTVRHGHWSGREKSPEYRAYDNMKSRCYNENAKGYADYGGRGIAVCDRWLETAPQGFLNFFEDMGEKPSKKLMLDRIDVNVGYSPENCRWVDRALSNFNQRRSVRNTSGRTGVYWNSRLKKWVAGIAKDSVNVPLGYFESFEEACAARSEAEIALYGELRSGVSYNE